MSSRPAVRQGASREEGGSGGEDMEQMLNELSSIVPPTHLPGTEEEEEEEEEEGGEGGLSGSLTNLHENCS